MNKIDVDIVLSGTNKTYCPGAITIDSYRINGCDTTEHLGRYLGYCSEELYQERIKELQTEINRYNKIIDYLWSIKGFAPYFAEHNLYVTKAEIEKSFGNDVADKMFSLPIPRFCNPDLVVVGDAFFLRKASYVANFDLNSERISIALTGKAEDYPNEISDKICLWNWVEGETDFAFNFFVWLDSNKNHPININSFPCNEFDCYDQWRGTKTSALIIFEKILNEIEKHGYLEKFKLLAKDNSGIWKYYVSTGDSSVGLYLIDKKAFKDKLLVGKINALLDACSINYDVDDSMWGSLINRQTEEIDVEQNFYFLQDKNDNTFVSKSKGVLGGHKKLKIYGKLDCPSAQRHIAEGKYVKHRVFFADEKTAQLAGYRPCAKCMKEEYKIWKSKKQQEKLDEEIAEGLLLGFYQ